MVTALKIVVPFVAGAIAHRLHKSSVLETLKHFHAKERAMIEERVRSDGLRKTLLHLDDLVAFVGADLFDALVDSLEDGRITAEERANMLAIFLKKVSEFFGARVGAKVEAKINARSAEVSLPDSGIRLDPPVLPVK